MRNSLLIALIGFILASCAGSNKMSHKKASSSDYLASESKSGKTKKVKANYRSNKYHNSQKGYQKVDDPTLRMKDASAKKKMKKQDEKRKMSMAKYLIYLNQTNRYKNSKVNTGKFSFY